MIYIGMFFYVSNQEHITESERRHGEFSLVVDADSEITAISKFKERLVEYRKKKDFFEGNCSIYLVQLMEFDRFPAHVAVMLNFKSFAGDPSMPFIGCSLPSDDSDWCKIYDWENNQPQVEGKNEHLFLEFKTESEETTP